MVHPRHMSFGLLVAATGLAGLVHASSKSSDIVTCATAAATETFEIDRGSLEQPEYARFGLIFCKARTAAPPNTGVEFSSHGPLQVRFFNLTAGSGKGPTGTDPSLDPKVIAQRLGLREIEDWKSLLDEMRSSGKLTATVDGSLANGGLWIGYAASLRSDRLAKTESDIVYSAGAMEAEKLETIPLERSAGRGDKSLDMALSFVTNLLGVIAGAAISYFFFRRQQQVIAKQDELKLFRQRKLEKAEDLLRFFREVYSPLRTLEDDLQAVRNIRRALVLAGIYSMLPLEAMDRMNAICGDANPSGAARGQMLDDLLQSHFRELMVES
ncbi:MAG: hypothetical protein NTW28_34065 [Candidatus Solibacter sp.]|nr:hypothetical protein [Candidatus Solibacter sp.]